MSTFDESAVRRQPEGVTTGGQFATKPKGEADVTLAHTTQSRPEMPEAVLDALDDFEQARDTLRDHIAEREVLLNQEAEAKVIGDRHSRDEAGLMLAAVESGLPDDEKAYSDAARALRQARTDALKEALAELDRLEREQRGHDDASFHAEQGGWDDAETHAAAANGMQQLIDDQRALIRELRDLPHRDTVVTDPTALMDATEGALDDVERRRERAAELAAVREAIGTRLDGTELRPKKLAEARRALRATRAPRRVVVLEGLDTIGCEPLEAHGHPDQPLTVVMRSSFAMLNVTSGTVVVHADSAWGNPVIVEDGATAVVLAAAGRKVSVVVKDSGVAVLVTADGVHGSQRRAGGDGSLDIVRPESRSDRITVRTPSWPDAVRPGGDDLNPAF